jgi:nitroreductase
MSTSITETIRRRYSCRAYLERPIAEETQRLLAEFLASNRIGPLGTRARFALVAATDQDRTSLKGLGTYGFIKGMTGFIVGAAAPGPTNLEDYGYLMEHAILRATDLGLGTCWLGGSFTKSSFARRIAAMRGELVPAVTAVGYPATDKPSDDRIRQHVGANRRLAWEHLFFDQKFGQPLSREAAGRYGEPLEMVRWAPSASNKQPWRIVRSGDLWHFFLQRTKRYGKGSLLFRLLRLADLQRVDMGIAMCHFELTARELGGTGRWVSDEPAIEKPAGNIEYVTSWQSSSS